MAFWSELKTSLRSLRKDPGFTMVAIATLGLGIAASTAIFSVLNGVVLQPLRYPEADRIVQVCRRWQDDGRLSTRMGGATVLDVRATGIFEASTKHEGGVVGVQMKGQAAFAGVFWVNRGFFNVFRMQPVAGRNFAAGDDDHTAIVSAGFAQRSFGDARKALGQTLQVEKKSYEIIGVAPGGFSFPEKAEIWICSPEQPDNLNRTAGNYHLTGKLKAGLSMAAAQQKMEALSKRLVETYPSEEGGRNVELQSIQTLVVKNVKTTLLLLMGASGLVLLIACANVANLFLARALGRSREIAVRTALGAGRGRVVRQLLLEGGLLALASAVVGVALAGQLIQLILALAPENLPRVNEVEVSLPVLLFSLAVAALSCLIFALGPAFQATRVDLQSALKQGSGRGVLSSGSHQLRDVLVACQVALAVVVAVAAGLLARSFVSISQADLGYHTEGRLVAYAHNPAGKLDEYLAATEFFRQTTQELKQLPGVKSAAVAMGLPAGQYGSDGGFQIEGGPDMRSGQKLPQAGFRLASPEYFATLGVPVLQGRAFQDTDRFQSDPVVIISATVARDQFAGQNPIGKHLRCGWDEYTMKWMTIVGVVGDVRSDSPASPPQAELYMPLTQHPYMANEVQVLISTAVPPETLIPTVRRTIQARNTNVALRFTTMEQMVADTVAAPRFRTYLAGCFALISLLLAMGGVYGVIRFVVSQRIPEFGLRAALGASPSAIAGLVLSRAIRLMLGGLAGGLLLALGVTRFTASFLYGVKTSDPVTYAIVVGSITLMVLVASALPARRAASVDPQIALRSE